MPTTRLIRLETSFGEGIFQGGEGSAFLGHHTPAPQSDKELRWDCADNTSHLFFGFPVSRFVELIKLALAESEEPHFVNEILRISATTVVRVIDVPTENLGHVSKYQATFVMGRERTVYQNRFGTVYNKHRGHNLASFFDSFSEE